MKKILLLLALLPLMASAYDAQIDGIYYNLNNETQQAEVTSGDNKYTGSVTIPSTVTYNNVTYSVTSIGNDAFYNCSNLTSVTIPNSVTSIERSAFAECSNLTEIIIPNSVTSIGNYAFFGTAWYDNQPDGLVYAGKIAYKYKGTMPSNTSISMKEGTLSVTDYAFSGCSGLTSVTIPNSVTSIGIQAFYNCSGLTSVIIPNSVTSIGMSAFYGCSALTEVTIGNGVTSMGQTAFSGCTGNLTVNCNIPSVAYAPMSAFYGSKFSSVKIGDKATLIGEYAFQSCSTLTSVTIGNSVTSLEYAAFRNCSNLTELTIGNSVTSIKTQAFYCCISLTVLTIPSSVTFIGNGAFQGCSGLTSVTIPNSMTSIGISAFYGCSGLTSVTIPGSVTEIGHQAFQNCSGLTSVTIPNSVISIGNYAFYKCSGLQDIYCYAENVPSSGDNVFYDVPTSSATLHVPATSVDAYKSTEPWSRFGTIKTLSGETPVIPETPKCATPTINFADGKLSFDCETEDVEFIFTATPPSEISGSGNDIHLSSKYVVTVYAKKDGYEDSDVATREIEASSAAGIRGDVNLDNEIGMPDVMYLVQYILNGKFPDE